MKLYLLSLVRLGFTSWEGRREHRERTASFQRGQPGHALSAAFDLGARLLHGEMALHSKNGTFT